MDIRSEQLSEAVVCVRLSGRLDTPGVDRVEPGFKAAAASGSHDTLVDLAGVSFLSSMGIRMLVSAARALGQRQKRCVLFAAAPLVQQTLQTMGIDQLMSVVGSEAEARALVGLA